MMPFVSFSYHITVLVSVHAESLNQFHGNQFLSNTANKSDRALFCALAVGLLFSTCNNPHTPAPDPDGGSLTSYSGTNAGNL